MIDSDTSADLLIDTQWQIESGCKVLILFILFHTVSRNITEAVYIKLKHLVENIFSEAIVVF